MLYLLLGFGAAGGFAAVGYGFRVGPVRVRIRPHGQRGRR